MCAKNLNSFLDLCIYMRERVRDDWMFSSITTDEYIQMIYLQKKYLNVKSIKFLLFDLHEELDDFPEEWVKDFYIDLVDRFGSVGEAFVGGKKNILEKLKA